MSERTPGPVIHDIEQKSWSVLAPCLLLVYPICLVFFPFYLLWVCFDEEKI